MEASDDDNEYDEDYEDEGRLHDALQSGCFVKGGMSTKKLSKG
jgi:hypothetical protein